MTAMTTPDPQRVERNLFGGMVWCGCGGMPVLTKWLSRNWQVSCGVCGTKTTLCRSQVKARAFWNRSLAAADAAQPTGRTGWDRYYEDAPADLKRKLSLHDFKRLGDLFKASFPERMPPSGDAPC